MASADCIQATQLDVLRGEGAADDQVMKLLKAIRHGQEQLRQEAHACGDQSVVQTPASGLLLLPNAANSGGDVQEGGWDDFRGRHPLRSAAQIRPRAGDGGRPSHPLPVLLYWLSVNWKSASGALACQGQGESLLTL
jgi:hypothetical protein